MLEQIATWSKRRLFWTTLLVSFLILDAASWILYSAPSTCIVKTVVDGANSTQNYKCPTLDIFLRDNLAVVCYKIWHLDGLAIFGTVFFVIVIWQLIAVITDELAPIGWFFFDLNAIEKFTLALVLIGALTAVIFQGQLNVMQGQLDAMKTEQQPFISLLDGLPKPFPQLDPMTKRGRILWNLPFENSGKGTAYHIKFLKFVSFGPRHFVPSDGSPSTFAMFPDAEGQVLAQGHKMYVTTYSPFSVTQDEFDLFANRDYGIASRIDFEYFDAFQVRYTRTVCVALLGNGVVAFPDPSQCH